tara:strand:- start:103200 stop:104684 length:1485 start_codon:yes stop_codon:yes gene_type:complete
MEQPETRVWPGRYVSIVELRFLAIFVPALFLVLVLMTAGYEWHSYSRASQHLKQRLGAVASNLSIIMAEPLDRRDGRQIRLLMASVIADDAVAAFAIYDVDGALIDNFGVPQDEPVEWRMSQFVNFADQDGLRQVGRLEIAFTDRHLWEQTLNRLGFAVLSVGVMLLAALVIVHVSYSRSIGRPIDDLRRAFRETRDGARGRVTWDSDDEIGDLMTAFNALQDREEKSLDLLKQTQSDLERRVRERTHDLEQASTEALLANRAKTQFLAAMSHEFRTPLNATIGFASLLLEDADSISPERRSQYLEEIVRSGDILLSLLSKLLDYSELETGTLKITPEAVDPLVIVEAVIAEEAGRAAQKAVHLDFQTALAGGNKIFVDGARYRQIVTNLLVNAIKYNRSDGRVFVSLDSVRDGRCRLTVRDTGEGISDAMHDKVFIPFDRLGREAGSIDGAGIGLALVKQLTTRMGGEIDFTSVVNEGSTFWVEFPFVSGACA